MQIIAYDQSLSPSEHKYCSVAVGFRPHVFFSRPCTVIWWRKRLGWWLNDCPHSLHANFFIKTMPHLSTSPSFTAVGFCPCVFFSRPCAVIWWRKRLGWWLNDCPHSLHANFVTKSMPHLPTLPLSASFTVDVDSADTGIFGIFRGRPLLGISCVFRGAWS